MTTRSSGNRRRSRRGEGLARRLGAVGLAVAAAVAGVPAADAQPVATSSHTTVDSAPATADAPRGPVGPAQPNILAAMAHSVVHPEAAPPGANDWSCRPTADKPHPVILLHGTFLNAYVGAAGMAPALRDAGYCVFAPTYGADADPLIGAAPGVNAIGDIRESSRQVGAFVERVRAATGAERVDLVGHSQGALVSRHYVTLGGGAEKVRTLVSLAGSFHGTTLGGIAVLGRRLQELGWPTGDSTSLVAGTAARQQLAGSDLLAELDAHGDTVPGVRYAALATRYDEVVNPYESQFIAPGPGAEVHNVTLQDGCEQDLSEHGSVIYNRRALHLVRQVLGDPAAAGPAPCEPTLIVAQLPPG